MTFSQHLFVGFPVLLYFMPPSLQLMWDMVCICCYLTVCGADKAFAEHLSQTQFLVGMGAPQASLGSAGAWS